ncbi:MAG: autotransporter outer membrane beta-barrel domain-containing protein [Phascolarctobacterium sp.]|nr:autotransporter outer membrane beta-barrel domain-containing protein [Phascolarctobacterium sp.]
MSKKIMKRSLALGALMAFVITGSAMAKTYELPAINATNVSDFSIKSGLDSSCSDPSNRWSVFTPEEDAIATDRLVTNGDIEYSGGSFGLYAAYFLEDNNKTVHSEPRLDNPNGNTLEIKNNITVTNGDAYLYGAGTGWGYDKDGLPSTAENNSVYITGGSNQITIKASGNIYVGGAISVSSVDKHNLKGNTAKVENVKFESGQYVSIWGGLAQCGSADGNEAIVKDVVIADGNIAQIIGGITTDNSGVASNNAVSIEGNSKIIGTVYGGYSSNDGASNNTIVLKDNADVANADLYGSNKEGIGNRLVVDESYTGNGKINTVGAFDEIEIDEMKYGEAALDVENMNYKEADAQGKGGTKLTVNKMTMSGDQELTGELEIIKATNSNLKDENNQENGAISDDSSVTIYKGTSEIIDVGFGGEAGMELKEENIKKSARNDQVLVIGESRAAATAFVNQGSELVETGLDALARDNAKAGDTKAFAAVYGNASEYATGSHVKVNGWSGIVGVGKTNANGLTMGVFFENGTGNYRTYNTVNNDFMRGDGEATYNGGGFLVRKDNANGVYTEASLRAGNLQNELRNAVRGSEGLAGYDVDTFYYGAHVGVGKVIPRGNKGDSIDVYGKFMYTHHSSEDFNIDGSDFHFDSVDSERLRLGFRINEVQTNKLSMYYGAAWEYEFGGDAENTTVGYDLSTPSLGGSTMIGEIGMHYLASEKWSLDLNVRGYSGQRDGFTGSVQANYNF